jgi:glutamate synthase domain-containing protein 3
MKEEMVRALFRGNAGQSFGAFLAGGITFILKGSANDYPGKGLSGGIIAAAPADNMKFRAGKNVIAGNAALYGATAGRSYFCGIAGERFCVRNSGAVAVAEGTGDHGCEYMTGGIVVILGRTGINFAAGMSGGIAYVLDEDQLFDTRCNLEMADIEPVSLERDKKELKQIISEHVDYTGSELGNNILFHWEEMWPLFVKIIPFEYGSIMKEVWEKEEKELLNGQG